VGGMDSRIQDDDLKVRATLYLPSTHTRMTIPKPIWLAAFRS
jgi:hypothetical protein